MESIPSPTQTGVPITVWINGNPDLPRFPPILLGPGNSTPGEPILLRPPISLTVPKVVPEFSTRLPIAYAFRPQLRTDLPWVD